MSALPSNRIDEYIATARHSKKDLVTYLVGLEALDSLLLLLLAQDDEWSTVFVECKTHFVVVSTSESEAMLISLWGIREESHTFRRLSCLVVFRLTV